MPSLHETCDNPVINCGGRRLGEAGSAGTLGNLGRVYSIWLTSLRGGQPYHSPVRQRGDYINEVIGKVSITCLLYTSPSPRD